MIRRIGFFRLAMLIALILTPVLVIAQPTSTPPRRVTALTRFVPADVRLFLSIRELEELETALERARVWPLFARLATGEQGRASSALRGVVSGFLGEQSAVDLAELFSTEVGLVSAGWQASEPVVWLARLPRPDSAERWFPVEKRLGGGAATGRGFRMADGLVVRIKEDVVAMGRRLDGSSVLRDVASTMDTGADTSLDRNPLFRELVSHLPHRPLALFYAAPGAAGGETAITPWMLPPMERVVVGLYESEGRVELAARAALRQPRESKRLSATVLERMLNLPQTTLLSVAAHLDVGESLSAAARASGSSTPARYFRLLQGFFQPSDVSPEAKLGPNVVLVWGQDLNEAGTTPQAAVLIECEDTDYGARRVEELVQYGLGLLQAMAPEESPSPPAIHVSNRLGTQVWHVPMKSFTENSKVPAVRMLSGLEPAWAISQRWLIVALTRDHLERILDAQFGLIPTLGMVREARAGITESSDRSVLAVFRGNMAGATLRGWLDAHRRGEPSLLDSRWWAPTVPTDQAGQKHLGIGMRGRQEAGVVVVARVHPGSPAEGRMQIGDRIVGVDGQLLDMHSPNASLRRRIAESEAPEGPTLRVLRNDQWIDVLLPRQPNRVVSPPDLAGLVQELAALADKIEFALVAIPPAQDNRYSARLSLRLGNPDLP